METLPDLYRQVMEDLATACRQSGRDPQSVQLLAVSKTHPADAIRTVYGLGQRLFGENYAQELAAKAQALADLADLQFVFIGAIQSNKLALIVRCSTGILSLASERHARLLAAEVMAQGKAPFAVHLLVNVGDEATKGGLKLADVAALANVIDKELPALSLRGLMAIPPPGLPTPQSPVPELYLALRTAASRVGAGQLSLGMSSDLAAAIAAGSDQVRIGTALFGARPPKA